MDLLLLCAAISFSVAFLVFCLFHTDALLNYGTLPGVWVLFWKLRLWDYKKWKEAPANHDFYYPVFFRENFKKGFWTELIGCPICMAGWGAIAICCVLGLVWNFKIALLAAMTGFFAVLGYCILSFFYKLINK